MNMRNLTQTIYPIIGLAVILLFWQGYTDFFNISTIVLPSPIDISSAANT